MSNISEVKIIFTGTVGAGKTTAINAISQIDPVSTEAIASDEVAERKKTTTVGMDYGEVEIDDGLVLRLYGTPGQARFRHMWEVLAKGAFGFIILIDNTRATPLADLTIYLDAFKAQIEQTAVVIAITRTDLSATPDLEVYNQFLTERDEFYPVIAADMRKPDDVLTLLDVLFTTLEVA